VVSLLVASCAGTLGHGKGKTAEELYKNASEDLKDSLYPEALQGFSDVKAKFPYSKYAALADLRTADTHFERGKYVEAIDAYRQFMKLHPNHEEVPYAMFRIGEAYAKQAPEDWFFMPPAAEKDQANTRLAISAYQDAIDRHPKSEYAAKAKERLAECKRVLAEHELYVAQFYWKNEKWRAAANRAEGVVRDYGGSRLDPEALLLAARALGRAGDAAEARADALKVIERFPTTSEAAQAKKLLGELPPAPAPAPAPAQGG
jgi:outer membrane protein assembly factor BamD